MSNPASSVDRQDNFLNFILYSNTFSRHPVRQFATVLAFLASLTRGSTLTAHFCAIPRRSPFFKWCVTSGWWPHPFLGLKWFEMHWKDMTWNHEMSMFNGNGKLTLPNICLAAEMALLENVLGFKQVLDKVLAHFKESLPGHFGST